MLVDGDLEKITAYTVAEAAQQGDALALGLLDSVARHLGLALAGMVNLLDLQCILIGGGLSQIGPLFLNPIRQHTLSYILPMLREQVRIDAATLGNDAGAIGAATMAFSKKEGG
jgi:glucokinase